MDVRHVSELLITRIMNQPEMRNLRDYTLASFYKIISQTNLVSVCSWVVKMADVNASFKREAKHAKDTH